MRTENYNPSSLEVDFAKAFHDLSPQIEHKIGRGQVIAIKSEHNIDNPQLTFRIQDNEGDLHEVVVKIIQRPDNFVK
ncbi:hypothetical protein H7F15_03535 [Pontibacter sp. Tf4]|uniref:hypothetical protein n=1 Tax=Pontibacter sp. Tf4 TaxID=2761620 RepID=UPI00162A7841|nr:hypothetical protein [Pontibacter sp. Tf4]MBB6610100.1 hypothetical protein [Pontibacter sp. Tf4]